MFRPFFTVCALFSFITEDGLPYLENILPSLMSKEENEAEWTSQEANERGKMRDL